VFLFSFALLSSSVTLSLDGQKLTADGYCTSPRCLLSECLSRDGFELVVGLFEGSDYCDQLLAALLCI